MFFSLILLIALVLSIIIKIEDKKNNDILESIVVIEVESVKAYNQSFLGKSLLATDSEIHLNDEEKKLLHISKFI